MRSLSCGYVAPYPHEAAYFKFYDIDIENQTAGVKHRLGYINSCGYRIACHFYQQAEVKGTVFLLHGYYDHVGLFSHIIRFYLQQGYAVLAYDLPGHGLSSGKEATIADFAIYRLILQDLVRYCEPMLPKPWLAYGQSTGCAIITDYLSHQAENKNSLSFDDVVLSAPLIRPWLWRLSRIQLYLARPFIRQLPRKFTNNSRDQAFLNKAHNDPLAPGVLPTQWVTALDRWIRKIEASKTQVPISPLILQGTDDTTVDGQYNIKRLHKLYNSPKVLWLEGAKHHLPNELTETRNHYMQWLQENMTDNPQ